MEERHDEHDQILKPTPPLTDEIMKAREEIKPEPKYSPSRASRMRKVKEKHSNELKQINQTWQAQHEELRCKLEEKECELEKMRASHETQIATHLQTIKTGKKRLEAREDSWDTEYDELSRYVGAMEDKVKEAEPKGEIIREEYNLFIRKQQEQSFRQLDSARWRPVPETEAIEELEKIKRDIKNWSKLYAVMNMVSLEVGSGADRTDLLRELAAIGVFPDGHLPTGLSLAKAPALLLNAYLPIAYTLSHSETRSSVSKMTKRVLQPGQV